MPIEANVTNQQITASVGETKIDVSVGGGVGPTGPAGPQGPAGTASSHASTHAAGGSDPVTLTVAQVTGLQAALDGKQATGSYAAASHTHDASAITAGTLAAARLPASVVQTVDGIVASTTNFSGINNVGAVVVYEEAVGSGSFVQISFDGIQFPDLSYQTTAWTGSIVASAVASGTLDIARIPTGTTSTTVALGNHAHGNLTSTGAIGSTSGLVVVTGASGALTTAATISAATQVSGLSAVATSGSASDLNAGTLAAARLPVVLEQTQPIGNSTANRTLSLSTGSVQTVTLSASCTFTMPTATAGASITLILTQGANYTATFTGVRWPNGTAPTITATANAIDLLVFVSDGTNWYGVASQKFS